LIAGHNLDQHFLGACNDFRIAESRDIVALQMNGYTLATLTAELDFETRLGCTSDNAGSYDVHGNSFGVGSLSP
jgi:hypothetical protein